MFAFERREARGEHECLEILTNFGDDFEDLVDKKSSSDIDEVNGSFESPDTSVLMSPGSHLDVANYAYENIDTLKKH